MPLLDVFWAMLWFFVMVLWFFLLFRVIVDIFRSRDLGGWGKAAWTAFIVLLPFLGVFVYLIARGATMAERDAEHAKAQDDAFRAYVRQSVHDGGGTASELAKLADLHDHGTISDADYDRGKEQILSRPAA